MFVLALRVELLVLNSQSLKAKRHVVKSLVETARSRFHVASSEVDFLDLWQRAGLGFAAVGSSANHVESIIDEVERFVWSHPEVNILMCERSWLDAST